MNVYLMAPDPRCRRDLCIASPFPSLCPPRPSRWPSVSFLLRDICALHHVPRSRNSVMSGVLKRTLHFRMCCGCSQPMLHSIVQLVTSLKGLMVEWLVCSVCSVQMYGLSWSFDFIGRWSGPICDADSKSKPVARLIVKRGRSSPSE